MSGFETNEISTNSNGGTELSVRSLQNSLDPELLSNFQIIPSRVRELDETKIRIYQQHDLPEDPEVSHLKDQSSRDRFHKIIYSSNWQMNEFALKLGIPFDDKIKVIETPIVPFEFKPKSFEDNKIRLIYFSTPQRGLEILVPVVANLAILYPKIHLDVFSSFKIYGWEQMDKNYEPLYEQIRNHPNMSYHGFSPNETIREYLEKAHILAYPNIWTETACRVLIESMSAGLLCVHPNLGALSDTSGNLTSIYQFYNDKQKHFDIFSGFLENAILAVYKPEIQNYLTFVKTFADSRFNLNRISYFWKRTLEELLFKYPTEESRKIIKSEARFIYKT